MGIAVLHPSYCFSPGRTLSVVRLRFGPPIAAWRTGFSCDLDDRDVARMSLQGDLL